MVVIDGPERGAPKASLVGQFQLHSESLVVVVSYPLVFPGNFLDTSTSGDDLRCQTFCPDDPSNLARTEQTVFLCTATSHAWASKFAAIVLAILIGYCEAAPVIGHTHVDLGRLKLSSPEKVQSRVNLGQVGMRLDLGSQTIHSGVPWSMKVVSENSEPVNSVLHLQGIHALEILVLGRKNNRDAEVFP